MNSSIIGKVVQVLNSEQIVINKGEKDGVSFGQRFLIYKLGEELFDPETRESLGHLELVCGEGKPEHIQDKMTTLISSKTETKTNKTISKKTNPLFSSIGTEIEERYEPETFFLPFKDVEIGCLVRRIK